jgi:RsiW-degrading membrane proteinase PrsW (M82 family)
MKALFLKFNYLLFTFWLLTNSAFANGIDVSKQPGFEITIQDVFGIITGLACWFTRVALVLIVVAIIFYGVQFLTAQGNPSKLSDAKKSFLWGLVGVLVILGTYTIIATVANSLGADYTLFLPLNCPN